MKKFLGLQGWLILGLVLALLVVACAPAAPPPAPTPAPKATAAPAAKVEPTKPPAPTPAPPTATPKPVTLRYAQSFPVGDYLPLYAGIDKGFFRDEGLTMDVAVLSTGDKQMGALLGGSLEIASYTPDWLIRAVEKGEATVKIVMGGSNVPIYSLVTPKEVKSYADLKGKRIAVSALKSSDAYFTIKMMAANGLKEADYSLIQVGGTGDRAAALQAGSVSAALLAPPTDQRMVDEGLSRLDVLSKVMKQYAWVNHWIKEDWAKANRATLIRFIRAWIKTTRWVYDPKNKEEAIGILARNIKLEDKYARRAYEMYFEAKTWEKDGELGMAGLQVVIDTMAELGDLTPPLPKPEKYVDMSYWQEALKSLQ